MRQQWRIGGNDDDDRPRAVIFLARCAGASTTAWYRRPDAHVGRRNARHEIGDLFANRYPGDAQLAPRAVVALDEDADRPPANARIHPT